MILIQGWGVNTGASGGNGVVGGSVSNWWNDEGLAGGSVGAGWGLGVGPQRPSATVAIS
jgi:hypothetical protein